MKKMPSKDEEVPPVPQPKKPTGQQQAQEDQEKPKKKQGKLKGKVKKAMEAKKAKEKKGKLKMEDMVEKTLEKKGVSMASISRKRFEQKPKIPMLLRRAPDKRYEFRVYTNLKVKGDVLLTFYETDSSSSVSF
jgi:hypothetical protein